MALGVYKVIVQLAPFSGLPEDTIENVFHITSAGANTVAADVANIATALTSFYNDTNAPATKSISDYIGEQVSRAANACTFLTYYHDVVEIPANWGSPVGAPSWTLGASDAATELPAEVAVALSYHGDLTDVPETQANPTPPPNIIRPASRRRGRIFIGPLTTIALFSDPNTKDVIPDSVLRTTLAESAIDLGQDLAANSYLWCVASKADDALYPVVGGYVDYAFDTQRRRGTAPSNRLVWTA